MASILLDSQPQFAVEDTVTEVPSIPSVSTSSGPAIKFLSSLLLKKPDLFQSNILSWCYSQFSGRPAPSSAVYAWFESFITQRSNTIVSARRNGEPLLINNCINPIYIGYDPNPLIMWARNLAVHKQLIEFEPVMAPLSRILNAWILRKNIIYNGRNLNLETLAPLCYNAKGENFLELIPYICYLMTFMIHCKPYAFDEAFSNASGYAFTTAFEQHCLLILNEVSKDYNIDVINADMISVLQIPEDRLQNIIKTNAVFSV